MKFAEIAKLSEAYYDSNINDKLHPDDVMYRTGAQFYYKVGKNAMDMIFSSLSLTWLGNVRRVLDLPCGHGRVSRHLRAAFPQARLFFCDIDKEGTDFCAESFDGTPIYSEPDLTKVKLPSNMDLIWVGSLFTHVDLRNTTEWLSYLSAHLSDHGILVATFHGLFVAELAKEQKGIAGGADWAKVLADCEAHGYGFATYPNNYGVEGYGISLSKASKIMDIAVSIPGTRVLAYTERGWANNHDVLVLAKHDRLRSFASYVKQTAA